MKKLIKKIFSSFGYRLVKNDVAPPPSAPRKDTMMSGMIRASKLINKPGTIVDLGAAQGNWSREAMKLWPGASYLLFEPLMERKTELEELKKKFPNIDYVIAGAGAKKESAELFVTGDLDGSGFNYNNESTSGFEKRQVDVTSVDEEVRSRNCTAPFILKFDTHGFEIPILEGSKEVLRQTELVIMECYGFHLSPGSLLFHEMVMKLDQYGFRLTDIVEVERRPGDGLFWQCDAFFLRKEHPSFLLKSYQ